MTFLEPFIGYLLAFGGVAIGIVSVYFTGKKSGEKDVELDNANELIEKVKEAKEIENNIDKLSNDDKRDRLRSFFNKT